MVQVNSTARAYTLMKSQTKVKVKLMKQTTRQTQQPHYMNIMRV